MDTNFSRQVIDLYEYKARWESSVSVCIAGMNLDRKGNFVFSFKAPARKFATINNDSGLAEIPVVFWIKYIRYGVIAWGIVVSILELIFHFQSTSKGWREHSRTSGEVHCEGFGTVWAFIKVLQVVAFSVCKAIHEFTQQSNHCGSMPDKMATAIQWVMTYSELMLECKLHLFKGHACWIPRNLNLWCQCYHGPRQKEHCYLVIPYYWNLKETKWDENGIQTRFP